MSELNFKKNSRIIENLLKESFNEQNIHSKEDAFILLINNTEYENLSNLCEIIYQNLNLSQLSISKIYEITQMNHSRLSCEVKKVILKSAYECLEKKLTLGNKTINNGKINTSSWFSHSLYVAEVCSNLAKILGLNEEVAQTLGLLHDIGRKSDHTFNHVIKGCESLYAIGWYNEAIACLTHSFVNGGRCSNNEPAIPGFYLDDAGNPKWEEKTRMDDVSYFLKYYDYTDYDNILNIADLMATDKGIVSPYDRIQDIATRRTIDLTNRAYFLSDFTNLLIEFMKKTNSIDEEHSYIKPSKDTTIEEITDEFKTISEYFYEEYLNKSQSLKETKKLVKKL